MNFAHLGLTELLLKSIEEAGYTTPTPIQAQVIPHILEGRDVFGCAQTGTGKTASFLLPIIDRLTLTRARARMPRTLILEPTRELAAQVADDFATYSKHTKLKCVLLIGGESMVEQEKNLNIGADILIATPGRFMDLAERGKVLLNDIRHLVIDEADRMLDMGFMPDIEKIVSLLPRDRQTSLFSATMPPAIRKISKTFLNDAVEVIITPPAKTAVTIQQFRISTTPRKKREALRSLMRQENIQNAIIFCNRKRDAAVVCSSLQRHGFQAGELHGDLSQGQRTDTLEGFKKGEIPILVASDVAARGLDIDDMPCVINFDVPTNSDDYVHRIGRTGRAGKEGTAYTFIIPEEEEKWKKILRLTGAAVADYTQLSADLGAPTETEKEAAPSQEKKGRRKTEKSQHDKIPPQVIHQPQQPQQPQRQEPAGPVVGFGDEVPAFLRVTLRVPEGSDQQSAV